MALKFQPRCFLLFPFCSTSMLMTVSARASCSCRRMLHVATSVGGAINPPSAHPVRSFVIGQSLLSSHFSAPEQRWLLCAAVGTRSIFALPWGIPTPGISTASRFASLAELFNVPTLELSSCEPRGLHRFTSPAAIQNVLQAAASRFLVDGRLPATPPLELLLLLGERSLHFLCLSVEASTSIENDMSSRELPQQGVPPQEQVSGSVPQPTVASSMLSCMLPSRHAGCISGVDAATNAANLSGCAANGAHYADTTHGEPSRENGAVVHRNLDSTLLARLAAMESRALQEAFCMHIRIKGHAPFDSPVILQASSICLTQSVLSEDITHASTTTHRLILSQTSPSACILT